MVVCHESEQMSTVSTGACVRLQRGFRRCAHTADAHGLSTVGTYKRGARKQARLTGTGQNCILPALLSVPITGTRVEGTSGVV